MASSCCDGNEEKQSGTNLSQSKTCCSSNIVQIDDPVGEKVENCCNGASSEVAGTTIRNAPATELQITEDGCCGTKRKTASRDDGIQRTNTATSSYRIEGMDCPSCAATLEKGLATLPNYQNVSVNYGAGRLKLDSDGELDVHQLETEVNKLGFQLVIPDQASHRTETFTVSGMDCSSCAKTIEQHFQKIADVQTVTVSFPRGEMDIAHQLDVRTVLQELQKIGFDGQVKGKRPETTAKRSFDGIALGMSGVLIGMGLALQLLDVAYLPNTFYGIALLMSGWKVFRSAYYGLRARSLDMNVLMSVAAIGAALIGEWLEGATVLFLFAIGNLLQNHSLARTRNSIQTLVDLAPKEAFVLTATGVSRQPIETVRAGEQIRIRPGDQVALDGKIVKGTTTINQAPITGESIPVDKREGDQVFAGTLNMDGSFDMIVEKTYEQTTLASIIELVEEAQDNKAPSEAFIDRFAKVYTPFVFLGALLVMVIPPVLQFGSWGEWFYKGLELIVIACPCALVISTPVAIVTAIGNAARNGVLIKGGVFLEQAGKIEAVAFDKTGTLTKGEPVVQEFQVFSGEREQALRMASSLERHSSHPLAKAIVAFATKEGVAPIEADTMMNRVGNGVTGEFGRATYHIGGTKWFGDMGYDVDLLDVDVSKLEQQGYTVVWLADETHLLAMFCLSDAVREESVDALRRLKNELGIKRLVMVTGDNEGAATHISRALPLDEVHAQLLPQEKVHVIDHLKKQQFRTAMVGDGINDAPAFVTADLSIAMGGAGTDTALETADIVLMADNLKKLPYTFDLSKATLTIIKQNIVFSILIKVVAMLLVFPGWLTLWMAVLSDTGAAVLVTLNALRLLRNRQP
ncbi:heavy metal translocating P-type ATPase [uncultured Exiguobacterium sp.]|uniref:heavy metal translocating P-type ATPase n=1 Tax=uncultured Exiguobacterium sp. TaxID=202669 RepID=UPI0025ED0235|nr:heavy metal translocating P-type ATPase [uncultured Exiguobacterium sp.]